MNQFIADTIISPKLVGLLYNVRHTNTENDIDITDRLYQVVKIVDCPIIDHLIISLDGYNSFEDTGL